MVVVLHLVTQAGYKDENGGLAASAWNHIRKKQVVETNNIVYTKETLFVNQGIHCLERRLTYSSDLPIDFH